MASPERIERARLAIAAASNAEVARVGRALFPSEPERVAWLRAAALRLYACRMTPEEWSAFLADGAPAAVVVDAGDAAMLDEAVRSA